MNEGVIMEEYTYEWVIILAWHQSTTTKLSSCGHIDLQLDQAIFQTYIKGSRVGWKSQSSDGVVFILGREAYNLSCFKCACVDNVDMVDMVCIGK